MTDSYAGKPCPKCGHVRAASETAPDWQCPRCGIAYQKFVEAQGSGAPQAGPASGGAAGKLDLAAQREVFITQKFEMMELLSFETRNRYRISDAAGRPIGYAAEENTGWAGFFFRQILGHWRTFQIHVFDNDRRPVLRAVHPFRIYFSRLEIHDAGGKRIGAVQKQFGILTKKFTVEDARGATLMEVSSPLWRLWTFPFMAKGREVAKVEKKWSGLLSEAFSDRDNFRVEFGAALDNPARQLVLAAAIYVDLTYFERKGD